MSRTDRMFKIIQVLRRRRTPTTGQQLAAELEVSLRTLYRDMAELALQSVPIRGEAGTGYVLDGGYDMPPLMLTPDELEAAVLGAAWVAQRGDAALARGAQDLIAKLTQAVPPHLRPVLLDDALRPVSFKSKTRDQVDISLVRTAIRDQRKLHIRYSDADSNPTERTVWPFLLAYFEEVRTVVAHCELRNGFRHFRTDRIQHIRLEDQSYPGRRELLRRRWEAELETTREARCRAEPNAAPGDQQPKKRSGKP